MKKTKGKKRIFLLALMILVVMAIGGGMLQRQSQIEKVTAEEVPVVLTEEQVQGLMPSQIQTQQQQVQQEVKGKISYEQCVIQWNPIKTTKNAAFQLEQGKVQVTFEQKIDYAQAIQKIAERGFEVDKIVNIFGMLLKKQMSDAESFDAMKTMILKSGKKSIVGKEIETACGLLQELEIHEAMPIMKFNFVPQQQ